MSSTSHATTSASPLRSNNTGRSGRKSVGSSLGAYPVSYRSSGHSAGRYSSSSTSGSRIFRGSSASSGGGACRFIPCRSSLNLESAHHELVHSTGNREDADDEVFVTEDISPRKEASLQQYKESLALLYGGKVNRILNFSHNHKKGQRRHSTYTIHGHARSHSHHHLEDDIFAQTRLRKATFRVLPKSPERVLDMPNLRNDYYSHLLDWSSTNHIATALGRNIYLLDVKDDDVIAFPTMAEANEHYLSLGWSVDGKILAAGTNKGDIQIWDARNKRQICKLKVEDNEEVVSLAWKTASEGDFAVGTISGNIHFWNIAERKQVHVISNAHKGFDVCGLKFNGFENRHLLASGGDDWTVRVWNWDNYKCTFTGSSHESAVRAMAWNPHHGGILATGGGFRDGTMRIWNVDRQEQLGQVATNSQICSLLWNKVTKEIFSSHWTKKRNVVTIWKYPSLKRNAILRGHVGRILHMVFNPSHTYLATASADESLRIWKVVDDSNTKKRPVYSSPLLQSIR